MARPLAARLLADATAACQDAEAIIYAPWGFAGAHIAERNRVPAVLASLLPLSPTRAFPARARPPGGWVAPTTLLSHLVAEQFGWQPFRG